MSDGNGFLNLFLAWRALRKTERGRFYNLSLT